MKYILPYAVLLFVITFITIFSCKKTNNGIAQPSLNQLFSALRTTPQNLSVTAGRDTIVFGADSTMLHFYVNSFKDINGNIITSGTVNLQLIEMYKPGDMIANRATTMASGQILQSGGEVNIYATMNGDTVYANKYGIGFKEANYSNQIMALFYGNINNADSVTTWSISDTSKAENNTHATAVLHVGHPWPCCLFDSCTNFSWINCDQFNGNDSPKTSVSVILPDNSFNAANTQLYLVLPGINSVMSSSEGSLGNSSYNAASHSLTLVSEDRANIVIAGMNYELFVIANKNGNYYYYQTAGVVPHDGININAAMVIDTKSDIIARLGAL
jgi:hypothetical protein